MVFALFLKCLLRLLKTLDKTSFFNKLLCLAYLTFFKSLNSFLNICVFKKILQICGGFFVCVLDCVLNEIRLEKALL